ncbi:NACHT, LRR and PYD domains-containing protein 3-like [Diadema antillarum]|uniref:NACHT, LRR and PYD domains-containing protein 3-like n=1 Tax=Diadema antillarum TaxID=105358 RepID=UPI003A862919
MESVNLDEIYTNLSLIDQSSNRKTPILYKDLLNWNEGRFSKRILIQGEGGVGKTTFCSKIAWDWCNGEILQDLNMVLVIPLWDSSVGATIGGIVKKYLSVPNEISEDQIDGYISKNLAKIILVFDGFDEFGGKIEETSRSEVIRILGLKQYQSCKVIVTTRPWRADEFTMNRDLAKTYTFVSVEGFNEDNVKNYIQKYFRIRGNEELGKELISFMAENDDLWSNMAPFPIFCAMLCLMWNDVSEKKRREILKLETFSQIFRNMISFLKDHYTSKASEHLKNQDTDKTLREASEAIRDIGEIALEGLLKRDLSFPEEHFKRCRNSMLTCCRVGVLTMETDNSTRRRRWDVTLTSLVETRVSFPHKLFQEYIAGIYVNTVFNEDPSRYATLKDVLLRRMDEFRYVIYFSSHMEKKLGLDIITGLVENGEQYFCVDVAFECHTEEASRIVGRKWGKYVLSEYMPHHTKSAVSFMVKCNQAKSLLIEHEGCIRTVSRGVAGGLSSSDVLRSVEIHKSTCQISTLVAEAPNCQL